MIYPKGVWASMGPTDTIADELKNNLGIVGVGVTQDWNVIETADGVYDWSTVDSRIANAKAAGFDKISLGITNSSQNTPAWLLASLASDQKIGLLDPADTHATFCQLINTALYWNATFHAKRLALIAAAGERYASDPAIITFYASFANHNSLDWNIQDTQGTIACGSRGIGGNQVIDQPKQWIDAGWTRAKILQVGKDIADAVALAFPTQNIKLPIGGLNDALANAPAYQCSVILNGTTAITAPAYVQGSPYTNFTAADIGHPITGTNIPGGTTITAVADSTHATMSAAATGSGTVTATFSDRNPDPFQSPLVPGNFSTLAREIYAYVQTKPYHGRFFIQRNTVDANWGTYQLLLDNPPGPGSDRFLKKMVGDAAPTSGLQDVAAASACVCDGIAQCRQNGNRPCVSNVQVLQDSLNVMLSFGVTFMEIFPADAKIVAFYDIITAATLAAGGLPRGSTAVGIVPVPGFPTANFRDDVLYAIANKMGLDPKTDLMVLEGSPYVDYINSWIRKTWDCVDWPEWTVIEERTPNAGNYVSFDQPDKTPIGKVLKVYLLDPFLTRMPVDTQYRLNANGIHCGFEHGETVFVKFMKRAPSYTSALHDDITAYALGDLVYDNSSGNVYVSLANSNVGPIGDAWAIVPFPVALVDIVVQGAYSDALREEGQFAEAKYELATTIELISQRARAALGLPYDLLTDQQRPASRYRAANQEAA